MQTNRQIVLAQRPVGFPKETDFGLVDAPHPQAQEGQVVVETLYLSVDPYMRILMTSGTPYSAAAGIGEAFVGYGVGRVVASRSPALAEGQIVVGTMPWMDRAVVAADQMRVVDPALGPVSTALGVLGMPGLSAYFGLLEIAKPRSGETVVVSGAAGAVGAVVGQIARIKGCRVVGIAGGDDKVSWLVNDLKFDEAYNYRTTTDHRAKLASLCPKGIDVYFDNVGGTISDAVLTLINTGARISLCGQISQYNTTQPEMGPRLLLNLVRAQARMEGWLVFQFAERYPQALREMAGWLASGQLVSREHVTVGLENLPKAFIGMLQGANTGKALVKTARD